MLYHTSQNNLNEIVTYLLNLKTEVSQDAILQKDIAKNINMQNKYISLFIMKENECPAR